MNTRMDARAGTLALVALFCLTWSSAFPAAKYAISVSPPELFLGIRFIIAAAILLGAAAATGAFRGPRPPWLTLAFLGLLNQAAYNGLAWQGMRTVSAGLATIIGSLTPITVAVGAFLVLNEPMTARRLIGLLLGLLGAAFIVRERITIGEDMTGIVYAVGALVAITTGTIAFKRFTPSCSLLVAVGAQQGFSGIILLSVGLLTEDIGQVHVNATYVASMLWFIFAVSIGAFMLWFLLLRRGSASSASALHFIMPPLGLVMSWLVLGERLRPLDLIGVVPIAIGILLVTRPTPVRQARVAAGA